MTKVMPNIEWCVAAERSGASKHATGWSGVIIIFLALSAAGCCTRQQQASAPAGPVTSAEAQSIASAYIVAARGACGTGSSGVADGGEFWHVQTVYGLGERPGPELNIDKITRRVTIVHEAVR